MLKKKKTLERFFTVSASMRKFADQLQQPPTTLHNLLPNIGLYSLID